MGIPRLFGGIWLVATSFAFAGETLSADPRLHWAFRQPVRPAVPAVDDPLRAANPVDAFLADAHRRRGLRASPPADPDLWLRRVHLDLIGLPPTREELHAFRADRSPDARERVVDRLLASPRYGERWGRHWMDVWRYSDWFGLGKEVRFSHLHVWRWRDWILDSLNGDKGYDRMVLEMLAGDELAPGDPDTLRATGFLARSWNTFNRNAVLDDVVEHTSRGFLGLTVQCARCHDHKFDPISQVEYYRLRAFFAPHHIRIDRVPGAPDRSKDGLTRVFDAFLEAPTYLFTRGDEEQPERDTPLGPAVPAALGGREVEIRPVPLPPAAYCPDKQEFVVREALAVAERTEAEARSALEATRQGSTKAEEALPAAAAEDQAAQAALLEIRGKPEQLEVARTRAARAAGALAKARQAARAAPEDLRLADLRVEAAAARRAALEAVIHAERLEDTGVREQNPPAFEAAAREACAAQKRLELEEAREEDLAARRASERAEQSLDGLTLAAEGGKDDPALKAALERAAAAAAEARQRIAAAKEKLARAETSSGLAVTTAYTPRKLEYPRAPIRYNETPPGDPYPRVSSGRRLALARWIADPQNPLTARVAVNHIWARHFGEPLAASMFDFGLRAPRPVLADLLDWLAVEFMESGWRMKRLHRLLVLSRAYGMRSASEGVSDPNLSADPDNRYLWRMNTRRMEGEVIRDSLLQLAGKLDLQPGGPDFPVAEADAGCRRTIYYRHARDDRLRMVTIFDGPSVQECYRRHETIVPQQALVMANSKVVLTRAAETAAAIDRELEAAGGPATRVDFITSAFERMLSRPPTGEERAQCEESLAALAGVISAEEGVSLEARARASLVHVLLNHNDFISIR
jgi:hypothetical protein